MIALCMSATQASCELHSRLVANPSIKIQTIIMRFAADLP